MGHDPWSAAFRKPTGPPVVRKGFKILSPKPNSSVKVILTSSELLEAWGHYQDRNTIPCIGKENGCGWCIRQIPPRVKYYAASVDVPAGRVFLIEITPNAVEKCPTLITPGVDLRGKLLTLTRKGSARNSPVYAILENQPDWAKMPKIPEPFNVELAVKSMWGDPFEFAVPVIPTAGKELVDTLLPEFGGDTVKPENLE